MILSALPVFLFVACVLGLALALLVIANIFNPVRSGSVKKMPYESGMDPIHDTRRRFDVRFNLLAIAFLVFDVELLFLYPWAVAMRPASPEAAVAATKAVATSAPVSLETTGSAEKTLKGIDAAVAAGDVQNRNVVFVAAMFFIVLLTLGYVYDWRKGVFRWH